MLREERQEAILENLNKTGIVRVADLTQKLETTEMTIRRDLQSMEERGLLLRIHGGARSKDNNKFVELSLHEKREINTDNKMEVAQIAATLVKDDDIIYIGPGTTAEFLAEHITASNVKVITNSLNIFERFRGIERFDLILVGGRLRPKTNTFVGSFANDMLAKMRVKIAFIGANGVAGNDIMTSNEEEGHCQKIIMNNAIERYLLCDSSKIEKEDFYTLYKLEDITALITDSQLDRDLKLRYIKYCKIIDTIQGETV